MSRATSPLAGRMVFVIGGRRSGTNWMQRILAAHPDAVAVPTESNLFSTGLAPLEDRFQHGAVGAPTVGRLYMDRGVFLDALRDFCDAAFGGLLAVLAPNARHLVERSPMDTDVLAFIGDIYPDATFVHIIRDGRDVARSLVSADWGPASIAEAASEWRNAVESARAAGAALAHYHEVRYEELLADPATGVPALYEAIGFDTSDDAIASAVMEAGISYNADPKAPQLAHGKWRDAFSADDLATFLAIAGPTLASLGYDVGVEADVARTASAAVPSPSAPAVPPGRTPLLGSVRRVAGRVRRARPASMGRQAFSTEVLNRLRAASEVLDAVLADLAAGRHTAVTGRLGPAAPVQLAGGDDEWRGRGEEGHKKLAEAWARDPALQGRQVRGDVFPAIPLHTLVATYATDDGLLHDRVLVVGIDGDALTTATWYRFPPRPA